MRLAYLELEGFRGWPQPRRFALAADVVLVTGPNGTGKTSVFDAILWALTGEIARFGEQRTDIISKYSESGLARVELGLVDRGEPVRVIRTFDGSSRQLQVHDGQSFVRGTAAEAHLMNRLWPAGITASDGSASFGEALSTAVYLQQDEIQAFIHSRTEQQRYTAISELFGTRRVGELQQQLERERTQWTRGTNEKDVERKRLIARVSALEDRVAGLASGNQAKAHEEYAAWIRAFEELNLTGSGSSSASPGERLQTALATIEAAIGRATRRRQLLAQLEDDLQSVDAAPVPKGDASQLETRVRQAERSMKDLAERIATQRQAAEAEEAAIVARADAETEMRNLATLALRHLTERCPVCEQDYDRDATRQRLKQVVAVGSRVEADDRPAQTELRRLETEMRSLITLLAALQNESDLYRAALARRRVADERLQADLGRAFSVPPADVRAAIPTEVAELERQVERWRTVRDAGENIALTVAQAAEAQKAIELRDELAAARQHADDATADVARRERAGALANQIIDALRASTQQIAEGQMASLDPLLSRIYDRIDPHPAFRSPRLSATYPRGRGHMSAVLADPEFGVGSINPAVHLSSSQTNALALSIFLALNLGMARPPLELAILDDPLQSLDDINLLGVVDLLRRCKKRRQLVISTHDAGFGDLLQRKLRPATPDESLSVISVSDWTRGGPTHEQFTLEPAADPWKVVA